MPSHLSQGLTFPCFGADDDTCILEECTEEPPGDDDLCHLLAPLGLPEELAAIFDGDIARRTGMSTGYELVVMGEEDLWICDQRASIVFTKRSSMTDGGK